jgi:hypothetical protein
MPKENQRKKGDAHDFMRFFTSFTSEISPSMLRLCSASTLSFVEGSTSSGQEGEVKS